MYKLVQHDVHDACNEVLSDVLVHDGASNDALAHVVLLRAHQVYLQVFHYHITLDDGLVHLGGEHWVATRNTL